MPTPCAHGITHDAGLREVRRVLRPGGTVHLMLYHRRSLTGYLLWARYGLLAGRPGRSLAEIYAHCLESPGTQAFSREDVRRMVSGFSRVRMRLELSSGDLVRGAAGQRHGGSCWR